MPLTSQDLGHIETVVKTVVTDVVTSVVEAKTRNLATKEELANLKASVDRMEGRLIASMSLLQRDTFIHLDEHEVRITRLEATEARP